MIACIVSGPGAADDILNRAEKVFAHMRDLTRLRTVNRA